jgi:hypothetical protein
LAVRPRFVLAVVLLAVFGPTATLLPILITAAIYVIRSPDRHVDMAILVLFFGLGYVEPNYSIVRF